ncbi:hypothetical protein Syun_015146 [Stephania yunnanensis]|uniref:Thioredoxin domain-containing protein n=1 Tax=Stephania yunnanensis TaxID=152371 RepID=A0AAP0JKL3_9MAGN
MASYSSSQIRSSISLPTFTKADHPFHPPCSTTLPFFMTRPTTTRANPTRLTKTSNNPYYFIPKASSSTPSAAKKAKKSSSSSSDERVRQVHTVEEFDEALRKAQNKLVVVEYAASHSYHSKQIYPFMVELSRTCSDVEFLLVMGDESEGMKELCKREGVEQVPHFSFYKGMEKIHEEEGIGPDQLMGDVLYYGDSHSEVVQLHSREDVEKLVGEHEKDHKLIVLDVGLKHCGPCVKVYPTVLKLSRSMSDTVVFARMNGDENESCMDYLKEMDVVEVPTFLFIRDGKICGRYVGSGKGELIGEILRYQGVRVT